MLNVYVIYGETASGKTLLCQKMNVAEHAMYKFDQRVVGGVMANAITKDRSIAITTNCEEDAKAAFRFAKSFGNNATVSLINITR